MKAGDRVKHNYLGRGTVVRYPIRELCGVVLVKWDKTPDIRYNMGENPCIVFLGEVEAEKEGK